MDKFNQFKSSTLGKFIEKEDPSNYAQCMDLAFAWCDILGIPRETIRHLYAFEVYTKPSDITKKYFDLIPNGPTNTPLVGDLVVFGTKVGVAGHISIETGRSNSKDLITLDQNWGWPKYTREITHFNYDGVLGWLHPRLPLLEDQKIQKIQTILQSSTTSTDKLAQIKQIVS